MSACLPTLGPLARICTRALGVSTADRSTERPSVGTDLETIGGSGAQRPSQNLGSGNFIDSKVKNTGSRPFKRLHGEQQEWSQPSKMTSSVKTTDLRDAESVESDEMQIGRAHV